jgi:hypothetical protein
MGDVRPFEDLGRQTGLLWLINTSVFHPRGYALELVSKDGKWVGWRLIGNGREPFMFLDKDPAAIDECFRRATETLSQNHDR